MKMLRDVVVWACPKCREGVGEILTIARIGKAVGVCDVCGSRGTDLAAVWEKDIPKP